MPENASNTRTRSAAPRGKRSLGNRTGAGPCPGRAGTSPSSSCMDRLPAATSTRGAISPGISASGLTDGRQPSSVSPIEPLCYTDEEFAEMVRSANPPGTGRRYPGVNDHAIHIQRDSTSAGTTSPSVRGCPTLHRGRPVPARQAGSPPGRRTAVGKDRAARP
jgi:hypothetical protein